MRVAVVTAVVLLSVLAVSAQSGSFTDSRDGKTYQTVKIGNQTWMAENLNYQTDNSWCYENDESNCQKYGRLYDWNTAMSACPAGWRLPSRQDWKDLENAAGGNVAGKKLKSKSGWKDNGNGTDDYGFSALPGGDRNTYGPFNKAGNGCCWWSATEGGGGYAWNRSIYYKFDDVLESNSGKANGFSVRCVR